MEIVVFITWLLLAGAVARYSASKGNSALIAFLVSIFFSPLIGFLLALASKPNDERIEEAKLSSGAMKKCLACAELIKIEAQVCRFCGKDVASQTRPMPTAYDYLKSTTARIWIKSGDEKNGPYTQTKVRELWDEGSLTLDTVYWAEGMAEWRPIEELFQSLN